MLADTPSAPMTGGDVPRRGVHVAATELGRSCLVSLLSHSTAVAIARGTGAPPQIFRVLTERAMHV